jgi:hypothetical protein
MGTPSLPQESSDFSIAISADGRGSFQNVLTGINHNRCFLIHFSCPMTHQIPAGKMPIPGTGFTKFSEHQL